MLLQRRRLKQTEPLGARLANEAKRLREEAESLPPGEAREVALRKARLTERALQMNAWLASPGLQSPK